MSDGIGSIFTSLTAVAMALLWVTVLAVIVSNRANTTGVISAGAQGFATDIDAAVSPLGGGSPMSMGGYA